MRQLNWVRNVRRILVPVGAVLVAISACDPDDSAQIETTTSAATSPWPAELVIPLYSYDDTQWSTLLNAFAGGDPYAHVNVTVIVNGSNNGPDDPSTANPSLLAKIHALQSHIQTLHSHGMTVLGYVNNATTHVYQKLMQPDMSHSAAESAREAELWSNSYGTNGAFYDLSWRVDQDVNESDLANAEGLAIATGSGCTTAMFNWSVPYPQAQRYLECIRLQVCIARIMDEETSQTLYATWDSSWNWIFNYQAGHFVNAVNSSSLASASSDFNTMRQRNAMGFVVTDRADYNALPSLPLFKANVAHDGVTYTDWAGPNSDPPNINNCPPPAQIW
jgi:hypothetical protein